MCAHMRASEQPQATENPRGSNRSWLTLRRRNEGRALIWIEAFRIGIGARIEQHLNNALVPFPAGGDERCPEERFLVVPSLCVHVRTVYAGTSAQTQR